MHGMQFIAHADCTSWNLSSDVETLSKSFHTIYTSASWPCHYLRDTCTIADCVNQRRKMMKATNQVRQLVSKLSGNSPEVVLIFATINVSFLKCDVTSGNKEHCLLEI